MEEQNRNIIQEGILADVSRQGMFAVNRQALSEAIRGDELSQADVYAAHREFSERTGCGQNGLAKVVDDPDVYIDDDTMDAIDKLRTKISKYGLESLTHERRWDVVYAANRKLLDVAEAEGEYKDEFARHDYAKIFDVGLCGLDSVDNLLYGVQRGIFSHEDINKREYIYLLTSARGAIYKYGMRGLSSEQMEVVDYCLDEGLLTEVEVENLEIAGSVVELSDYR